MQAARKILNMAEGLNGVLKVKMAAVSAAMREDDAYPGASSVASGARLLRVVQDDGPAPGRVAQSRSASNNRKAGSGSL